MRVVHHQGVQRIDQATVAGEIRANLARQAKTQLWLATETGIKSATLSRRLGGKSSFTLTEISAIADALAVPVDALLGGVAA